MSKAYIEAVETADTLVSYQPETSTEQLVAIGYRAGLDEATAALYQSITAEQGNPKQILSVFHRKLEALSQKFEAKAKELKV